MRKELPAARSLPAQIGADRGGVDGEQNQATLTGAVSCRALPYLRSGRKMDEAVNRVLIGSVIAPDRQCGAPFVFATHMINQGRRHDGDANASLAAPTSLNATAARRGFLACMPADYGSMLIAMKALTYIDGIWHQDNPPLLGAMSHATWQSSIVFDGARAFEGCTPDLDRHCQRVVRSAHNLGLAPMLTCGEIEELARDGVRQFARGSELYIRPMFFAEEGFIVPLPESTRFALSVYEAPLPSAKGFSVCLSSFRRPAADMAPTDAKASCLYPNSARALSEALGRGYDNAVVLDPEGNVAEFATSNLFCVKDGVAHTPIANGTFLAGVTRQRVIQLLRDSGTTVHERSIGFAEVLAADEVFSTGNYGKVLPVTRVEKRDLQPGPVYTRARELYWDFAHRG
jgi:branched-chain amino acid aminotransferase